MTIPARLDLFAVCLPGLETMVAKELQSLGIRDPKPTAGGVAFEGGVRTVYRVNVAAGLVGHVLIRVAEFGARSLQDLDIRGARVDWSQWLPKGVKFVIKASCRRSRIYHSGAAAERIDKHVAEYVGLSTDSVGHPAGEPPGEPAIGQADATGDPILIRVRIQDNRCTISLDSSGAPLHRRGWRLQPGRAPLREDLARALVVASGWDRNSPLLDPMMGSGTILIEAATMARGLAPGRLRRFACEQFAPHDAAMLAEVKAEEAESAKAELPFRIVGSDREPEALVAAAENAERAGVRADLDQSAARLSTADVALPSGAEHGALVTNPPYGKRLDDPAALVKLYRSLGDLARRLPAGFCVAIAAADRRLALRSGLTLESAFLADSGGLKIRALRAVTKNGDERGPDTEIPSSAP